MKKFSILFASSVFLLIPAMLTLKNPLYIAPSSSILTNQIKGRVEYKGTELVWKQAGDREKIAPRQSDELPFLPACINGNFEYGDFTNWGALAGTYTAGGLRLDLSAPLPGRHTIMTGNGIDPIVGGKTLPRVSTGSYAVRLGNSIGGAEAEGLRYTFTVTDQNKNFTFSYAIVLQDPGHQDPDEQPFFMYTIKDSSNNTIKSLKKVADSTDPYFDTINSQQFGTIVYKNWDCELVDLSNFIGQVLTIEFVTADCQLGGHFGYAYIDDICYSEISAFFTLPQEICLNDPIVADGSPSSNEMNYFWSIEESDANWGRNPQTEVWQWFLGQQAGVIDLKDFYASKGGQFKCNTYYRIKLAVGNSCVPWNEIVRLLYVKCPPIADAGPDKFTCCSANQSFQLGTPPISGYTYRWTSEPHGFTSTEAMPLVQPTCSTTYTLTVKDQSGCPSTDKVSVSVDKPFAARLSKIDRGSCDVTASLSASLTDQSNDSCIFGPGCILAGKGPRATFLWSTGETTSIINVNPSVPTTYSVIVSNACSSRSASIAVEPCPPLTGDFPTLIAPNAFTPDGDGKDDLFVIYHLGLDANVAPAYNAVNWLFIVYDRFGHEIAHMPRDETQDKSRCQGIPNGTIPNWDGSVDGSSVVLHGVYSWKLYLKNCSHDSFYPVQIGKVTIRR